MSPLFSLRRVAVALAIFGGLVVSGSQAQAAKLVVTSPEDTDGDTCGTDCTLRQALTAANADDAPDTIVFDPTVFASKRTIYVGTNFPEIMHDVSIVGPTTSGTGITLQSSGTTLSHFFRVHEGTVTIANLTMKGAGNAVMVIRGDTTVAGCTLVGNWVGLWNVGLWGYQQDPVTFKTDDDHKIVDKFSTLTANNCTLVGNGVGAWNWTGPMMLKSCTITGNTKGIVGDEGEGTQTLSNCLVVGNILQNLASFSSKQTATYLQSDHNTTTGTATEAGLDPKGLQDNGGPTQTVALIMGSAAVGTGVATSSTDQRGLPRPKTKGCDMGAFQTQPAPSNESR